MALEGSVWGAAAVATSERGIHGPDDRSLALPTDAEIAAERFSAMVAIVARFTAARLPAVPVLPVVHRSRLAALLHEVKVQVEDASRGW
jgi:hypothetical protein